MEPIIFFSQFITANFLGSVIGGIITNRTDDLLCRTTTQIYNRLRNNPQIPANHEIQSAVRKSYLNATRMACKSLKERKYSLLDRWYSKASSNIDDIQDYLKQELSKLSDPNHKFPLSDFDKDYVFLLKPQHVSSAERIPELVLKLKESVFAELEKARLWTEIELKESILNGWKEDNKKIDWFALMKAFFAEELKTNTHLSTIIENELLMGLDVEIQGLKLNIVALEDQLQPFLESYQQILPKLSTLDVSLKNIEDQLVKLPKEIRDAWQQDLVNFSSIKEIPKFTVNTRYQYLTQKLEDIKKEQLQLKQEITDWQEEIAETSTPENLKRKQRHLYNAEIKFIAVSEQKNETQVELKEFIHQVLSLANTLSQEQENETSRLKKARELFENGLFEEANKVLNEKDIYNDITQAKKNLKNLAQELIIKAKATTLNKKENWFEKTKEYYLTAIEAFEDLDTIFGYACFLQDHNQFTEAENCYIKLLQYTKNEYQKAVFLNNLGNLQRNKNEYEKAEQSYHEALEIRRKLAEASPQIYLPDVAATLNNLGVLWSSPVKVDTEKRVN